MDRNVAGANVWRPLVQEYDVSDVPEDGFSLVEHVGLDVAAGLHVSQVMRRKRLHLFHKLNFTIDQAMDQLTLKKKS